MDFQLIMLRDDGTRRAFPITKSSTTIGRREDCDLRIAVNDVSRKHCKVRLEDGVATIVDLGSSNGTFVNGKRVTESPLAAGDRVKIGPVLFVAQIDGEPDEASIDLPPAVEAAPKPRRAAPTAVPPAGDDGEIDELAILNDSAGGEVDLDLGDSGENLMGGAAKTPDMSDDGLGNGIDDIGGAGEDFSLKPDDSKT